MASPEGTPENSRRLFPPSFQDGLSFGANPGTSCLANVRRRFRDKAGCRFRYFQQGNSLVREHLEGKAPD
jgi:hypothetical protein